MFYPGQTILQTFLVPFNQTDIGKAIVSYKQNGHIVLEKEATSEQLYDDVPDETEQEVEENNSEENSRVENGFSNLYVWLYENDTLLFEDDMDYTIQINVFSSVSGRQTSSVIKDYTGPQYYRQVGDVTENNNQENITENNNQEEEVTENVGS